MKSSGKHVLSHAGIYLVARGVPGVMAFLAIPLFTRLLTPADYGRYALVVATVSLLNAMLFQWLRLSLVRYLPAYKADPARLKSTLVTVSLILCIVLGAVGAAAFFVPALHAWRGIALPCWVVLTTQAFFDLSCEYTRSAIRPWQYMGLQLARSTSVVGVGAALVALGASWWGPLAGMSVGMAVAVAFTARRDWNDVRFIVDRDVLRVLVRYGVPLSLTVALTVVISTSDRFLIAWKLGEESVGLYAVATDFTSQTLTLLMMVINLSMFPLAVRAWEHDGPDAAREQMRSNASLLLAVGVPCVVGLSVLAPGVAHCFFGKNFSGPAAAALIPPVALATFVAGLKAYHFDAAFQFAHRTIYQVWIVLFAAIANVALNLIAIPRWGINGSAGASVLAFVLAIALTVWLGRRHFAMPFPIGPSLQVTLAAGVMGALLYPTRSHLAPVALTAQIAGGALAYSVILIGSNFLGLRDHAMDALRARRASTTRLNGIAEAVGTLEEAPVGCAPG